jgi:hypothetical protein
MFGLALSAYAGHLARSGCEVKRNHKVAQIFNLLYRRFAIGRRPEDVARPAG